MSAQPHAPAVIGKRKLFLLFAPLTILVAAAVVTNFGGGVTKDANAATVNVTAAVSSNIHITDVCGGGASTGAIAFGTLGADQNTAATCTVAFGSTNTGTTLNVNGSAANLGFATFTPAAATCNANTVLQDTKIGIRTTPASTATRSGTYNCATGHAPIPTGAAPFCTSSAGPDVACVLEIGLDTGGTTANPSHAGSLTVAVA